MTADGAGVETQARDIEFLISYAWFDRFQTTSGLAFIDDPAISNPGYEQIARYSLNFLDAYLKGSAESRAFLAQSPEENGFPPGEISIDRKSASRPLPTIGDFAHAAASRGLANAPDVFAEIRRTNPQYSLPEQALGDWGRRLMRARRLSEAIGVLRLNVQLHPTSLAVYDALGEAYDRNGDRALAIQAYKKPSLSTRRMLESPNG